jgi:hypothetical protein
MLKSITAQATAANNLTCIVIGGVLFVLKVSDDPVHAFTMIGVPLLCAKGKDERKFHPMTFPVNSTGLILQLRLTLNTC